MLLAFLLIGAALIAIHELGHYLMALACRLPARFVLNTKPIGFGVTWGAPKDGTDLGDWEERHIAVAGFGLEMLAALLLHLWRFDYAIMGQVFVLCHYVFYPFRMMDSDYNDFQYQGVRK